MAKKKKTTQKTHRKIVVTVRHRLVGVAMMAIGLFLLVSIVLTEQGAADNSQIGLVGNLLSRILLGFLGRAGIVVPSVGMVLGGLMLFGFKEDHIRINLAGFFVIVISLLGIFSVPLVEGVTFLEALRSGSAGLGGGVLGMSLAWAFGRVIGRIGTYILLVGGVLAGLLMFFEGFYGSSFFSLWDKIKKRRAAQKQASLLAKKEKKSLQKQCPPTKKDLAAQKMSRPEISLSDVATDQQNYQNIKGILMDQDIGKKKNPEVKHSGKDDPEQEAQLEFAISQDLGAKDIQEAWSYPPLTLLRRLEDRQKQQNKKEVEETARILEETLESFGVRLKIDQIRVGPSVTRYEAKLAPGVKVSKILRLSDDIALSLAASNIRIEAPIPGKAAVGIEVPNRTVREVSMLEVLSDHAFQKGQGQLLFGLGQDIAGKTVVADLADMPHLLVAGATGSGKSVCMNALICSLLYKYRPDQLKLLMIDPKKVEFGHYNQIPHLLAPVITDPKRAAVALKWMTSEMENRYSLFAQEGAKDIYGYNQKMKEKGRDQDGSPLCHIVILIDELSDLMMVSPAEVEDTICRLAQMARAAGMHLVVATQRPSVNVITGLIKANIPSRIAFAVSSQVDSRTILDGAGAEKLLGRGDMLFAPVGLHKPQRIQGAHITEQEVQKIVGYLKKQEEPEYLGGIEMLEQADLADQDEDLLEDELLWQAGELVVSAGQASISMLQRRLKIGYNRAARIIDQLEERKVIGGYQGPKARDVLVEEASFQRMREQNEEGSS